MNITRRDDENKINSQPAAYLEYLLQYYQKFR